MKSKGEVAAQKAEIDSTGKALEDEATTLDRTSEDAVAAYNAKVIARNGKVDAYRAKAEAYNVEAERVLDDQGRLREGVRQPPLRRPRPERPAEEEMTNPAARRPGPGPTACRLSPKSGPSTSAPAFAAAMRDHLAEIDALAASSEAPTFANTVAAFDRAGRLLERVSALFYNLTSSETSPALQAVRARHGAAARGARQPRLHPRRAVRSHRRAARAARPHRPRPGAAPRPGAIPPRLRPRRRQAGAARAGALRGDHAAARRADDALRPERPRRRERVPPGPRGRSRSRRLAGVRPRRGAPGGARARHRRGRGDHAVALAHRSVPHLFRAARPARSRLAGLDLARRARRRERQPRRRRRDPAASPRAGAPARLLELRRLRAQRHDGAQPGGGDVAARAGVAPGTRARRGRARGARGAGALARRKRRDRAVGLALLRREGAPGALRPRRSGGQALLPARADGRRRVRLRRPPVRHLVRRARRHRRLPPRRPRLRGARRGGPDRPLPARQLRPPDQAQRRLDELVPLAVEERRR